MDILEKKSYAGLFFLLLFCTAPVVYSFRMTGEPYTSSIFWEALLLIFLMIWFVKHHWGKIFFKIEQPSCWILCALIIFGAHVLYQFLEIHSSMSWRDVLISPFRHRSQTALDSSRPFLTVLEGAILFHFVRAEIDANDRLLHVAIHFTFVLVVVFGIVRYLTPAIALLYGGIPRANAFFASPNEFGTFILLLGPWCFLNAINRRKKIFSIFIGIIFFVALVMTRSEGAWLAFVFSIVWIFSKIGLVGLFLLLLSYSSYKGFDWIDQVSSWRVSIWKECLHRFMQSPWAGTGLGSFSYGNQPHAHNMFFQVLVETGLIGVMAVAGIFFSVRKIFMELSFRNVRDHGFSMGILAVIFHSFFDCTLLISPIFCLSSIFLALALKQNNRGSFSV